MGARLRMLGALATALGLAACGGGSGGSPVGSGAVTSAPPTAPGSGSQPNTTEVELLKAPATQQFAAYSAGDDLQIRYNAATGFYQVSVNNGVFNTLSDDPNISQTGGPNKAFIFNPTVNGPGHLQIRAHYKWDLSSLQYQYSNLAAWSGPSGSGRAFGFTAFGVPTQASAVPRTGSGAYSGFVEGYSTVMTAWDNEPFNAGIEGTVDLNFDFGAGTLSGQIKPVHYVDDKSPLPTLAFTNTVYSVGSQSFSGQFATNLPGANAFSGQFTGPQAEELIGKFAFPFIYSKDGTVQQATGAMIAKR